MRISINFIDIGPDELYAQVPLEAFLLRQIPGPDRPDYWLAKLERPVRWNSASGEIGVAHLVVGAARVGGMLVPGVSQIPVNIAYVVDSSVLDDERLEFEKTYDAARGLADIRA